MPAGKIAAVNRRGMVYFAALAVMVILTGFGLTYLYVAHTETMVSANELQALRTFYLAEAGVEHAIAKLLYGGAAYEYGILDSVSLLPVYGTETLFYRAYMPDSKTIVGEGMSGPSIRKIMVRINNSGFPGALMVGKSVNFYQPGYTINGKINGNIDVAYNTATFLSNISLFGRLKAWGTTPAFNSNIPLANFQYYESKAAYNYSTLEERTWDSDKGAAAADIHYVNGDLNIIGPGPRNISVLGTVVVKGNINIGSPTSFTNSSLTVTPAFGKPAIIAEGILDASGGMVSGTTMVFNGLVYINGRVFIHTFNSLTINGAVVIRHSDTADPNGSAIQNGNEVNINYDINLDPQMETGQDCFTGGFKGKPVIVSWQGHAGIN